MRAITLLRILALESLIMAGAGCKSKEMLSTVTVTPELISPTLSATVTHEFLATLALPTRTLVTDTPILSPTPIAKETLVTVTPKPPQKETPKIPVLGMTKEGIDLDDALAKMQTNPPTVPEWVTVEEGGEKKGSQACAIRLVYPPSQVISWIDNITPVGWQFGTVTVSGEKLKGKFGLSFEDRVQIYVGTVQANSARFTPTGVTVSSDLKEFDGKTIVGIGTTINNLKESPARSKLKGIGISR